MKNKILPILCIFIFVSFILINFSFAADTSITNTTFDYIIDYLKNTSYYKSGKYHILVGFTSTALNSDYPYTALLVPKHYNYYLRYTRENNNYYSCTDDFSSELTKFDMRFYHFDSNGVDVSRGNVSVDTFIFEDGGIYYSEANIYTDYTCQYIFYKSSAFNFESIFDVIKPIDVFKNLMSKVIVILLITVVSILAFRKGWSFLKGGIRKA